MRLIVIAFNELLGQCLEILNLQNKDRCMQGGDDWPACELRAVITVPTNITNKVLREHGVLAERIFSYDKLPECITSMYYDYVLVMGYEGVVLGDLENLQVPRDKIVNLWSLHAMFYWRMPALLASYHKQSEDYRIFITGMSYTHYGIHLADFKLPAINFACDSQDLYYDYQFALQAISAERHTLRYAIIGLAPYSFHFDLSKSNEDYRILTYHRTFRDVHHYFLSTGQIEQMFNRQFLQSANPVQSMDLQDVYGLKQIKLHTETLSMDAFLRTRKRADEWKTKRFPQTVRENKQILRQYIELCHVHGIRPLVVVFPTTDLYRKYFSAQIFDEFYAILQEIRSQTAFDFLDYFAADGFDYTDFSDCDHLNQQGSRKMTRLLDAYIQRLEVERA